MDRKRVLGIVLIGIFLIMLSLEYYFSSLTGLITYTSLSLSIGPYTHGKITLFNFESRIEIGDRLHISVEFRNTGSVSYESQTRIFIYDANFNLTGINFTDGETFLNPGGRRTFQALHYSDEEGVYWIQANVTYDVNKEAIAWGRFYVAFPEEPEEPGPGGPGGPGPTIPIFPSPERGGFIDFYLDYNRTFVVMQGQRALIPITLDTYGNTSLNNIILVGSLVGLPFDVDPDRIPLLFPNSTAIFLISIDVPEDAEIKVYDFLFDVIADEVNHSGHIRIDLKPPTVYSDLYNTIQNYRYLIQKLRQAIEKARLEHKDVTNVVELINIAEIDLDRAEELFWDKRYEATRAQLNNVRQKIIEAVEELAKLDSLVIISLMAYIYLIILILAAITIMILLFYFRKKRKEEEQLL